MDFRAVGLRCAMQPSDFLPEFRDHDELRARLVHLGGSIIQIDPVMVAWSLIGRAHYRRGARMREAPDVVDCSSFTKWVYGQLGIWIPRRSIQQHLVGREVPATEAQAGDLVFSSGWRNYYLDDPDSGIGHVGLMTGTGTVIHAANRRLGVVETSVEPWMSISFRGIRRILPAESIWTILTQPEHEVESADDLRWMLRIRSSLFSKGSS